MKPISADLMLEWLERKADAGLMVLLTKIGSQYEVMTDQRSTGATLPSAIANAIHADETFPL